MKKLLQLLLVVLLFASCNKKQETSYAKLVDPMIGTDFHGHTYPGAVAPFGMIQVSPDTRLDASWDGCSGYHYSDSVIYGFSQTHLSGTGCFDLCDIRMMPTTGDINFSSDISHGLDKCYPSKFNHNSEHAEAGFYSVHLDDYDVDVELTATDRVGYHKYSYPKGENGNVIIDLTQIDSVITSSISFVNDNEIDGERRSYCWAADQDLYFVIKFSLPYSKSGIMYNDSLVSVKSVEGPKVKAFVTFSNPKDPVVAMVGISSVSVENARKNLADALSFEDALKQTQQKWDEELSKIKVTSINDHDKVTFYTSLYHTMIVPNLYSDINGEYRGRDFKTHIAEGFNYYTVFSLWDTYRAYHPLQSIINQKRTSDFINTFITEYKQGGRLPVWELYSNETECMIGYHAIPVIYDAYKMGITSFDTKLALEAMVHSAELDIFGLDCYKKLGYISSETESESVSRTLEYAYDDWCIAMFAKDLGVDSIYNKFIKRAQSYKNIFDTQTGYMRAKRNNMWFSPFDPKEVNFNYTEANCWQYSFYVPQDVNTFINLMGGDNAFVAKLDQLFSDTSQMTGREQSDLTGSIGQYAHGNEPSHHIVYLYNYVGQPYKTQKLVRQIMDDLYTDKPDGLCGNEDCGQMSAWYVLSSLGFYPVCPGDDKFIFGSPKVKSADITLESRKHFIIETKNQSKSNIYVSKVTLNDSDYTKSYITYEDILNGGTLVFHMSSIPNKQFGQDVKDRPVNVISDKQNLINAVPFFDNESSTFNNSMSVVLASQVPNCNIYYTINGSTPTAKSLKYTAPFEINKTTTVKAISVNSDSVSSNVISTEFIKIPKYRKITLMSKYEGQYSAGGKNALVDFIRGGNNFRTGGWQGYHGQDIVAVVDLGTAQNISTLSMGFIQDVHAWIFFPTEVDYLISSDGNNFTDFGKVMNEKSPKDMTITTQEMKVNGHAHARYVKVIAKSIMKCPEGHEAAGNPAWLFADEITIQ